MQYSKARTARQGRRQASRDGPLRTAGMPPSSRHGPAACRASQDKASAGGRLCGRAQKLYYSGINLNNCQGEKDRRRGGRGGARCSVSLPPSPAPGPRCRAGAPEPTAPRLRPGPSNGTLIRRERSAVVLARYLRQPSRASPTPHGARNGAAGRKILSPSCENPGRALASCPRFRVEGGP